MSVWQIGQTIGWPPGGSGRDRRTSESTVSAMPDLHFGQRNARLADSDGTRTLAPQSHVTIGADIAVGIPVRNAATKTGQPGGYMFAATSMTTRTAAQTNCIPIETRNIFTPFGLP